MRHVAKAVIISRCAHHVNKLVIAMQNVEKHIDQNIRRNVDSWPLRDTISNIDVDAISEKLGSIVISDDELFADPPPKEDCEICFLPMPCGGTKACGVSTVYQVCCGKTLCHGCMRAADVEMKKGTMKPYCPLL